MKRILNYSVIIIAFYIIFSQIAYAELWVWSNQRGMSIRHPSNWKVSWQQNGVVVSYPNNPMIFSSIWISKWQGTSQQFVSTVINNLRNRFMNLKMLIARSVSRQPDIYGAKFIYQYNNNSFKVYLELYKSGKIQIDYLTFCGNGEDTLHPDFVRFCKYVMEIRKHYLPHIPLAILTGGGLIWEKKCLECLNQIDVKFVKLDVGNPEMFTRINRPLSPKMWEKLLGSLKNIIVQNLLEYIQDLHLLI